MGSGSRDLGIPGARLSFRSSYRSQHSSHRSVEFLHRLLAALSPVTWERAHSFSKCEALSGGAPQANAHLYPGGLLDINVLFDEVYPPLFRYCHRLTADTDVAEDVAQETFVRLLERRPGDSGDGLRPWMYRVATNLIRDRARQEANRSRILAGAPPRDPTPSPEGMVERKEQIREVREVLNRLSFRDREILILRQEGLSYKEIAQILDVAPTSIGTLLARSLKRFATAYRKEKEGNGTP